MNETIIKQTDAYYTEKINTFGATSRGVDWNSVESQELRFEQLTKVFQAEDKSADFSLCDYGCGYGAYLNYMRKLGYSAKYIGIDLSKDMIQTACELQKDHENCEFICSSEINDTYDYIIASGIFNVKQGVNDEEWFAYMIETLENFHAHSKKGFAFNCLTKYSDKEYMKDYLYYPDPMVFFDYAKRHFSRNVAILHDYELYEFTLIVRK